MASIRTRVDGWSIEEVAEACFAVVAGCFVGCVWWFLHRKYFVTLYWHFVPQAQALGFVPNGFDGVVAALNLATAIVQAFSVGFVTGLGAFKRPYYLAAAAMVLTFILKVPVSFILDLIFFDFDLDSFRRPISETWWIAGLFVFIYSTGPLVGAFFAQMFKPRPLMGEVEKPARKTNFISISIGIGAILSFLWKTLFFMGMLSTRFLETAILCLVAAQAISIGYCVARFVPQRKSHHALGVALLMLALDFAFFTALTHGGWPANTSDYLAIGGLALVCACAALGGAELAE